MNIYGFSGDKLPIQYKSQGYEVKGTKEAIGTVKPKILSLSVLILVATFLFVIVMGCVGNSTDHFNKALSLMNSSDYENALAEFNKSVSLDPQNSTVYLYRGMDYYDLNQFGPALNDFNKSIALDPQCSSAYLCRGECYSGMQNYPQSLSDLNEAIQLDPQSIEAYYQRAFTYEDQNQYSNAINDYDMIIKNNPTWYAYFYRAEDRDELQKYSEAASDYNSAINKAKKDQASSLILPYLYDYLGNDELAMTQWVMADSYYDTAIGLNSTYVDPYIDRAYSAYWKKQKYGHLESGDWDKKAIPWLTTAINLLSNGNNGNLTIHDIQDLYRAYTLRSMAYANSGDSADSNNDKNLADHYKSQLTSDTIPKLSGRLDIPTGTSTSNGGSSRGSSGTWTSWDTQRVVTGSLIGMY